MPAFSQLTRTYNMSSLVWGPAMVLLRLIFQKTFFFDIQKIYFPSGVREIFSFNVIPPLVSASTSYPDRSEFPKFLSRWHLLNPNRVRFLGVRLKVEGGGKITPCLKLVRIILETSNLARKNTDICRSRSFFK